MLKRLCAILITTQSVICYHYGSFSEHGSLITFTDVRCVEFPISEDETQCLKDSVLTLEEVLEKEDLEILEDED